jgi:nitrate/nitrite transporter NarK
VLRRRPPIPWVWSRGRQRRVDLVGALGGFVLPIIFDIVLDWLGINFSCFMFLYSVVWVSLFLNYTTEVRRLPVMGQRMSASAPAWHTTLGAP